MYFLKREVSTGKFIPEIDGLRFIAIFSVVIYHLWGFFSVKLNIDKSSANSIINIVENGDFGVQLFFAISGFVLALPFAKYFLLGENKVDLNVYFKRRITRLEPPYIIVMTVLFFASVYIVKNLSFSDGFQSYVASIFYVHNFVYGIDNLPLLNCVAWSLEIEVQFYILAPLISNIYKEKKENRRIILILLILLFIILNQLYTPPFLSLYNYIQYFLLGFLLVDYYLVGDFTVVRKTLLGSIFWWFFIISIFIFRDSDFESSVLLVIWKIYQLAVLFITYFYSVILKGIGFLRLSLITIIGGMCYSVYLLHYPAISFIGNYLIKLKFTGYHKLDYIIISIIILAFIFLSSILYFIAIEKPCMKKDWHVAFFSRLKNYFTYN